MRAADVAFIRAGRLPIASGYIEGAPDLAVEVLSPDDRPGYVREKFAEWLDAGAKAVWVADPRKRTVAVHAPARRMRALGETDLLRGGDALPGFELPVRDLFAGKP